MLRRLTVAILLLAPAFVCPRNCSAQTARQGNPAPRPKVVPAAAETQRGLPSKVIQTAAQTEAKPAARTAPASEPAPGVAVESVPATVLSDRLNLESLTQLALEQNPVLDRARADVDSAKGDRVQAALYPNPRFETNNPEIWAGRNSQWNFGFQQDIVTKGKIRLEKAAADQQVRKKLATYSVERTRMLTMLRSQYFQALAAQERVDLADQLVGLSMQSVEVADELVRGGQGALTDVLRLQTELERTLARSEVAQINMAGELNQLSAVAGVPELTIRRVDGNLFEGLPEFDEDEVRAFLASASFPIEAARAEVTRTQARLMREEVEPYPNLRMGPAYAVNTSDNRSQFWLSIVFDIPVWNLNQGNIRQAQAEMRSATANLKATRNDLLREASDIYAQHLASRRTAERMRLRFLPVAAKTEKLVREGYHKGQLNVNDLLQAQRAYFDAQSDLIDVSERAWTTAAQLAGMLQWDEFPVSTAPASAP